MIKKVLLSFIVFLPIITSAQYTAGTWKIHPFFSASNSKNLIDTGDKIYYQSSDNLFCFDKETEENEALDKSKNLSDVLISKIYYNYDKKYLVIIYRNSNIDIFFDNGKTVNMPEIKDAILTFGKAINDITFTPNGTMLVATEFGYVIIDENNWVVKESHIYYKNFNSIAQVGSSLVAIIDNNICCSQVSQPHDAISSFIATGKTLQQCTTLPVSGSKLFINSANTLYLGTIGGSATSPTMTLKSLVSAHADNMQPTPSGYLANFMSKGYYYTFDSNGGTPIKYEGGNELYTCNPDGDGTMWALGSNGLHTTSEESSNYFPRGITVKGKPFWMVFNESLNKLYIHTSADNYIFSSSSSCNILEVSTYDGTTWNDETPDQLGTDFKKYSAYRMCFNPNDPHTYFISMRGDDKHSLIYKVTDGVTQDIFKMSQTSPTTFEGNIPGRYARGSTAFDSEGNLWIAYSFDKPDYVQNNVVVLPKSKVNSTTPITMSDWITFNIPNLTSGEFKRGHFVISKKNDIKIFTDGNYNRPIIFWKGDINTSNPISRTYSSFTDQDGQAITWTNMRYMEVDKNGILWFTGNGICTLDPEDAFTDNCRVNHIKVPSNDGTDQFDYLLDEVSINCITVDSQNRKWIATATAGVYQVSEDGTQILRQFNTGNSMMPSNNVFSVACNDNDNSVFILTDKGLVEYIYGYTPTSKDLSNVYCYPNPVRPDYTGLITINGLTENALVKIADSSGNVIKQLKSAGGIATWDCCDANGDRVATGVYYVLASTSDNGNIDNIIAKFLVIK